MSRILDIVVFSSTFQGVPDPERVASEVQRMWVLTEVMRSSQSTAAVGRFDVSITWASPYCGSTMD